MNKVLEAWLSPTGIMVTFAIVGGIIVYMQITNTDFGGIAKSILSTAVDVTADVAVGALDTTAKAVSETIIPGFSYDAAKCVGVGTIPTMKPCREGWHNDGLTCREPIYTKKNGLLGGGKVVGRLDREQCPPGKYLTQGLCYTACYLDENTNDWVPDTAGEGWDTKQRAMWSKYFNQTTDKQLNRDIQYFHNKANK